MNDARQVADHSKKSGRSKQFNPYVHGARGLFAAAVFVFHVVNSGLPTFGALEAPLVLYFLRATEYGVELFFCISGFVITGTLQRASSLGSFIADRAIRIFPVLWITVLFIGVVGMTIHWRAFGNITDADFAATLVAGLLALPGIFPFPAIHPAAWSLSYEMTFYICCGSVWALYMRGRKQWIWFLAPALMVLLAFYPRALLFLCGVIVARDLAGRVPGARLSRFPLLMLLIFLAAWHGIQLLSLPHHIIETTLFQWADGARLPLAIVALWAVTIGFKGVVAGNGWLGSLLRSRPFQYLGTISYSFYLWHPIVMAGVKYGMVRFGVAAAAGHGAQIVLFVLALPPSLLVAHASQVVFEKGAGLWLRRRLHHPSAVATAALTLPSSRSV